MSAPVAIKALEGTQNTASVKCAHVAFNALVKEFSDARRASPRDCYVTRVATEPIYGRMLSDDEIGNLLQGILIATTPQPRRCRDLSPDLWSNRA